MGRPTKFSSDELLDVAAGLLADGGPAALTASGVARAAGAPSGSVYHRFDSRDGLAAALWMRTIERFDRDVVAQMALTGDPTEAAVTAAGRTIEWCQRNPVDALILTKFRLADLIGESQSVELSERAAVLGATQRRSIEALAERLELPVDLVRFAVVGVPMASIRRYVGDRQTIPSWVAGAVRRATLAALDVDRELKGIP